LREDKISVIVQTIPFKEDVVLAVFIIPDIERIKAKGLDSPQTSSVRQGDIA
jgi:hypothetical protein